MLFENLKYPILQAPIGSLASTKLASSVSNAGGMGALAMTWTEPDAATKRVEKLRAATRNPFFVNFVLAFQPKALDACLDAGAPVVTFSWGQPGPLVKKVHDAGAKVGIQVATLAGAAQALNSGADFLICQGSEAGGHVQSSTPLEYLLPRIVDMAGSIPVVATGGITTGGDLAKVLSYGAKAIMLGTRFVASEESMAHSVYKNAIIESESADSVYTICFNGGWPNATHRVLRNKTLDDWETAGCPQPGERPGEGDVLTQSSFGGTIKRYDDTPPSLNDKGDILDCCLYAGTGVGKIEKVSTASDVLADIWAEYQAVEIINNVPAPSQPVILPTPDSRIQPNG
ncbi:MAG: NAD(P)H-dependent flavin oxidoreductase [Anaerolineae bacterium]